MSRLQGCTGPAAADGYYVLLPHLSKGRHTLRVRGKAPAFAFSQRITYTLDVGPAKGG